MKQNSHPDKRPRNKDQRSSKIMIGEFAEQLRPLLSSDSRILTDNFEKEIYSRDLARVPAWIEKLFFKTTPTLVVQPTGERDIPVLVKFCIDKNLSILARGSGSFAFGGAVPTKNGIVLDLSPMNKILEIDQEKRCIRVEPGVRWADMIKSLEPYNLSPLTTPTSLFSTVGGWISTGGLGLGSFAHGGAGEHVLNVHVVRPNGSLETLDATHPHFDELIGTEGQFGILTEITLRVSRRAQCDSTHLRDFETSAQAFEFLADLENSSVRPHHVAYFDPSFMRRENSLFSQHTGLNELILPQKDSVLLHFDSSESEKDFLSFLNEPSNSTAQEESYVSRYLWEDRFFPLKAHRTGPGLLGTEVVLPLDALQPFSTRVRRLCHRFRIVPAIEVIACRRGEEFRHLVMVSFLCDYTHSFNYVLCLMLIQLMVRLAVRLRGHPYGIGIWNTSFVKHRYGREEFEHLKNRKKELDPSARFNPSKFFKIRGRFFGIPSAVFNAKIFAFLLSLAQLFSLPLGLMAAAGRSKIGISWEVPDKAKAGGKTLLLESFQRCTSCGSCVSVCPAYALTRNEMVTARTKLRLSDALVKTSVNLPRDAHAPFQCLHCGLCEEVCQTRLPLRECYQVLEDWLEIRFGNPAETIQSFIQQLESKKDFIRDVYGLLVPDWSPGQKLSRLPALEKEHKEGRA